MGAVRLWNSVPLIVSGLVAVHEDCCCTPPNFECCNGDYPTNQYVTITGVANDDCSNCTIYNDTFTCVTEGSCFWDSAKGAKLDCPVFDRDIWIHVYIERDATGIDVVVAAYAGSAAIAWWFKRITGDWDDIDCNDIGSLDVDTTQTPVSDCDESSSTCTMSGTAP